MSPQPLRWLDGPPSSGKSTLLAHSISLLDGGTVLESRGPRSRATDLLSSLLLSANLTPWGLTEIEQRNLLTVFIQERRSRGRRVVVAIDQTERLGAQAWEEIERLEQVSLAGKPAAELLLADTAPPTQRIYSAATDRKVLRVPVPIPSTVDVADYIRWRLQRFEAPGDLFTPRACQLIARFSDGRFAAVDTLCQMALMLIRSRNGERVDVRVVQQAMRHLAARRTRRRQSASAAAGGGGAADRGYLLLNGSGHAGQRVPLVTKMVIGRNESSDLCLPNRYVSRQHAMLLATPEGHCILDLHSVNGVRVNGKRVSQALLNDQDIVSLGPFRLKFFAPAGRREPSRASAAAVLEDTAVMRVARQESPALQRVK
jgi:hypothetical protein